MAINQPFTTTSQALVNYDYTDVEDGLGYISYFLTTTENSVELNYKIINRALPPTTTDGLLDIDTSGEDNLNYEFETSAFNQSKVVNGDIFLIGYIDGGASTITARLYKRNINQEIVDGGLGTITWQDLTEVGNGSNTFRNEKTITVGGFVNKIVTEIKEESTNLAECYMVFNYDDGSSFQTATQTTTSTNYVEKTYTNNYPLKKVETISAWIKNAYEYNDEVYSELISGDTEEILTDKVTTKSLTDSLFNLGLSAINKIIRTDEQIILKIVGTGTGKLVLDPTYSFETKQSLSIDIPYKLEL